MCMITKANPKCLNVSVTSHSKVDCQSTALAEIKMSCKMSRANKSRLTIVLAAVLSRPQLIFGGAITSKVFPTNVALDAAVSSQSSTAVQQNSLAAWEQIKESIGAEFRHRTINELSLPIDMDSYFDRYLSDEAPYSIERYQMESVGDTEFETSAWELVDATVGSATAARTIQYIHPVSNPMAPPMARAIKRQTYTTFGSHGLIIETQTVVIGVPKTDCFVVEDRTILEPRHDGDGILLSAFFDIRFTKKTVFRSIIEKATSLEFHEFLRGLTTSQLSHISDSEMTRRRRIPPMNTTSSTSWTTQEPNWKITAQSRLPWLSFITHDSY